MFDTIEVRPDKYNYTTNFSEHNLSGVSHGINSNTWKFAFGGYKRGSGILYVPEDDYGSNSKLVLDYNAALNLKVMMPMIFDSSFSEHIDGTHSSLKKLVDLHDGYLIQIFEELAEFLAECLNDEATEASKSEELIDVIGYILSLIAYYYVKLYGLSKEEFIKLTKNKNYKFGGANNASKDKRTLKIDSFDWVKNEMLAHTNFQIIKMDQIHVLTVFGAPSLNLEGESHLSELKLFSYNVISQYASTITQLLIKSRRCFDERKYHKNVTRELYTSEINTLLQNVVNNLEDALYLAMNLYFMELHKHSHANNEEICTLFNKVLIEKHFKCLDGVYKFT
jgi:predicted house-cleaning noncanonical NTP pyrophosphatase (MazG superfamily)